MRDKNLGLSEIHTNVRSAGQAGRCRLCEQPFGAIPLFQGLKDKGGLVVRLQSLQVGLPLSDHMVEAQLCHLLPGFGAMWRGEAHELLEWQKMQTLPWQW